MWINGKQWFPAKYLNDRYFVQGQEGRLHKLVHSSNFGLFVPYDNKVKSSGFIGYLFPLNWFEVVIDNNE